MCKSVFKMRLYTQDKKLEWPHAGRKSVLLIPVSWETFVSLFSPAGPLGSPSVWRLTSDRAAPLSVSKPSRQALVSWCDAAWWFQEVLPSKHLVVTSAVWLRGDTRKLLGLAAGQFPIFIHTGSIAPQKQPATPNFNSPGKSPEHK